MSSGYKYLIAAAAVSAMTLQLSATSPARTQSPVRTMSMVGRTVQPQPAHTIPQLPQPSSYLTSTGVSAVEYVSPDEALRRISAEGSTLQGFLKASNSEAYLKGWYDINTNGTVTMLYRSTSMQGSAGFVRNGKIHQFTAFSNMGYWWYYYTEYDLKTGDTLYEVELPTSDQRNYIINCAYDPDTDKAYLQTYNANGTSMAWSSFDPESREREYLNNTLSWDDNRVVAMGYDYRDKNFYGVGENGWYLKLDRQTGVATKIKELPIEIATYSQSMVYSPVDHGMIWAAMLQDNTSGFYLLDTAGNLTLRGMMPAQNEFTLLYCPDPDYSDALPSIPSDVSAAFDGPSLTGTVSVTIPATTFGGEAIPSSKQICVEVSIDGNAVATLTGTAGQTVTTQITTTQGLHEASAACRYQDGTEVGPTRTAEFYSGYDTPLAPGNVRIDGNTVKWDTPTGSVHGGYIDLTAITYNVYLSDIKVNTTPVSGNSVTFTEPQSLGIYVPRVEAIAQGLVSEAGEGTGKKYGEVYDVPFGFVPTQAEFNMFTTLDCNNDNQTWTYFAGKNRVYCFAEGHRSDDWLFMPLANFTDTEYLYRVSVEAFALLDSCPEAFEIWLCSDRNADATVQKVLDVTNYTKDKFATVTNKFMVENPDQYYIGIHANSTTGYMINLQNLKFELSTDTRHAPAECKGVSVTPGENGALNATVKFYAPTKALDGEALDKSKTITVHASTAAGEVTAEVLPGAQGSITVPAAQGWNTVTLTPQNDGGFGLEKEYEVFVGEERPGPVTNFQTSVSDDALSITLTWEPPTSGESGGFVSADRMGYEIYLVSDDGYSKIADVGDDLTYTYTVNPGAQQLVQIAVGAYNVAGTASTSNFKGKAEILGTPLSMPVLEPFTWGVPSHLPLVVNKPSAMHTAEWGLGDPTAFAYAALTPDYGAMYCTPSATGLSLGRVTIPRVTTLGYNHVVWRMNLYHSPQGGIVRILGRAPGMTEYVQVGQVDSSKGTAGYVDEIINLPESLQNKPWVLFAIETEFDVSTTDAYIIIDSYQVMDMPDNDLMLANGDGPTNVKAGDAAHYSILAYNNGKNTQTGDVKWEVLNGDNVIASKEDVISPLEPEESETLTFDFTPGTEYTGMTLTVRCTLTAEPDDALVNNVATSPLYVRRGSELYVDDLTGTVNEQGQAELTWSPVPQSPFVEEDFETAEHGDYSETIDGWRNVDVDGTQNCGIRGVELPGAAEPKAWQVIEPAQTGLSAITPNSGSKMLLAICPNDQSPADDWLISPEVKGGTMVQFAMNILTSDYTETIEVLASSTGNNPEDFTLVQRFDKNTLGWEIFSCRLPEDARYFAIRYCSVDQFAAMIDDIAYYDNVDIDCTYSYDVLKDGSKIANVTETRYTDPEPLTGKHTYSVLTIQNGNACGLSNPVILEESGVDGIGADNASVYGVAGGVRIAGCDGTAYRIATIDGRVAADGTCASADVFVPLAPGIYVVSAGKTVAKVIVK